MSHWNDISISEFNRGNLTEFSKVYRLLYPSVYVFCSKLIPDEAGDMASEAFLKLWDERRSFRKTSGIKAFLYATARFACLNRLKSLDRRNKSHQEILYLSQEGMDADIEMIDAEVINLIHLEIKSLPRQCSKVIQLIYQDGKSTAEVAEQLGITKQTVLNQKSKGLQLLQSALFRKKLLSPALVMLLASIGTLEF